MENTELVVLNKESAVSIFSNGGAQKLLDGIKEKADYFILNDSSLETPQSRGEIKTFARKIASSRIAIDNLGKDLVADWKAKSKLVDKERKYVRETLERLQDRVRLPLTDWERAEREKEEKAAELQKLCTDWIDAIIQNDLFDRTQEIEKREAIHAKKDQEQKDKEEKERLDKEQKEREDRIAKDAAEESERKAKQAELDKENAIKVAAAESERNKEQAIKDAEQAEKDKKQAAKDAEEKRVRDLKAQKEESDREAKEKEDARLAEEQKIIDDGVARENDRSHRAFINNSILDAFTSHGVKKEAGKKIIEMIALGKIQHIKIIY